MRGHTRNFHIHFQPMNKKLWTVSHSGEKVSHSGTTVVTALMFLQNV